LVRWSQRNNLKLRTVSSLLTDAASASAALDDLAERVTTRDLELDALFD
jgi:phosphate uptake regulator